MPQSSIDKDHLRRLLIFGLFALVVAGITELHDALVRGLIVIPPEWEPYVPWAMVVLSMLVMAMTPQLIRLRAAALDPSKPVPTKEEIAAEVVDSLTNQVEALIQARLADQGPPPAAAAPVPIQPAPAPAAPAVAVVAPATAPNPTVVVSLGTTSAGSTTQ